MEAPRRVLIVDHSKVVRSALAKHLRDHFEVREESDGESAWQTLVLDSSIIAVVSGAQLSRLSGYDLLARLRASKLRRLCDIPFLLVVSNNQSEDDRQRAREKGVTDFITRGMPRQEILGRIGRLVNWELAMAFADTPAAGQKPQPTAGRSTGVLSERDIRHRLDLAVDAQKDFAGMVGVLAFGLDNHAELAERFGNDTVQAIAARVAQVLKAKIGDNDSIGSSGLSRCIIVSPGTSQASCIAFAQRVCRGLANSQVAIAGEPFSLLVSAGIACLPADAGMTPDELIVLAGKRLSLAQQAGGGRVLADDGAHPELGACLTPDYFHDLLRLCTPPAAAPPLGAMGLHLMPLLKALDREFRFGLPLSDLERSFELRAREEQGPR